MHKVEKEKSRPRHINKVSYLYIKKQSYNLLAKMIFFWLNYLSLLIKASMYILQAIGSGLYINNNVMKYLTW